MRPCRGEGAAGAFMYTTAQLVAYYTNLAGAAPDAATRLTLDAYALQTQMGGISDAQALANIDRLWTLSQPQPPQPPTETEAPPPVTSPPITPAPVISPALALQTYYAAVTRSDPIAINRADAITLNLLANSVGSGSLSLETVQNVVARMAQMTTSVVNLTYQFFTGATPFEAGVDYLVGANGSNPGGLSGAAFQGVGLENRFINFAVNLGKFGDGQTRFATEYGGLSMTQAMTKAYADIFGSAPTEAHVRELLDAPLAVGDQTITRAQYFALFGQDGVDGVGAKAAMIGWLLAEAVKADVGPYAKAQDAFLADLLDGVALFHVDLLKAYGPNVGGDKPIKVLDLVSDKVQLDGGAQVKLQGVGATGAVTLGGDGNVVYLMGGVATGGSLSATGGANTLHLMGATGGVQGTVSGFQTIVLDAPPPEGALAGVKGAQLIYDMVPCTFGDGVTVKISAANHETVVLKNTSYGVVITDGTAAGAANVVVHLDHFTGAPSVGAADGGSITIVSTADVEGRASNGKVTLYVDGDSTVGMIAGSSSSGAIKALELRGTGKLTARIAETFTQIDARRAGDFDLTYAVAGGVGLGQIKTAPVGSFLFSDWTDKLTVTLGHAADRDYSGPMTFVLGKGADTIVAAKGALGLNNLAIVDQAVFVTAEFVGFKTGVDHLVLDAVSHGTIAGVQAVADGAASLTQALTKVSAQVAANDLAVFTYGGDTYVYVQDDLAGLNMGGGGHAGDGLIKLTGVTGLSIVTGAATGDIHWG